MLVKPTTNRSFSFHLVKCSQFRFIFHLTTGSLQLVCGKHAVGSIKSGLCGHADLVIEERARLDIIQHLI